MTGIIPFDLSKNPFLSNTLTYTRFYWTPESVLEDSGGVMTYRVCFGGFLVEWIFL